MNLYDHEIERLALGAISNTATLSVDSARLMVEQSKLKAESFNLPAHAAVFRVCCKLLIAGRPPEPLAVQAELQGTKGLHALGIDWAWLCEVMLGQVTASDLGFLGYAKHLNELHTRRSLVERLTHALSAASDTKFDLGSLLSKLSGNLAEMAKFGGDITTLRDVLDKVAAELDTKQEVRKTGIASLDAVIGGWQPTLNLVGALPGVGKSALFASTIQYQAEHTKERVGLISLEDEASWLAWRMLSDKSGVTQFKLRFDPLNTFQRDKVAAGFEQVHGYADRVFVVDGSDRGMTVEEVVNACNDMVTRHNVRCIFVDHLGELSSSDDDKVRNVQVGRQLQALRGVSNRFKKQGLCVPMVVAAHFRRREGLEAWDAPKPSDFAETAAAERKARVAIGLARRPDSDTMTLHILKQTLGKAGIAVEAKFVGAAAMLKATEPT